MKVSDIYRSRYYRVDDVDRPQQQVIHGVRKERFEQREKLVLDFVNSDQALALSATNARTLREQCGNDTDNWPGTLVELEVDPGQSFQGGARQPWIRLTVIENAPPRAPGSAPKRAGGLADMQDDIAF